MRVVNPHKLLGKTVRHRSVPLSQRWKQAKVRLTKSGDVQILLPVSKIKTQQNPYPVKIGVTKFGETLIGVGNLKGKTIADQETVYGSQIRHRVAAKTSRGWRIMTPSEAKRRGYKQVRRFPGPRR